MLTPPSLSDPPPPPAPPQPPSHPNSERKRRLTFFCSKSLPLNLLLSSLFLPVQLAGSRARPRYSIPRNPAARADARPRRLDPLAPLPASRTVWTVTSGRLFIYSLLAYLSQRAPPRNSPLREGKTSVRALWVMGSNSSHEASGPRSWRVCNRRRPCRSFSSGSQKLRFRMISSCPWIFSRTDRLADFLGQDEGWSVWSVNGEEMKTWLWWKSQILSKRAGWEFWGGGLAFPPLGIIIFLWKSC